MKLIQALEAFADSNIKQEVQKVLGMKKQKNLATIHTLNELLTSFNNYHEQLLVVFYDMDGKNFREMESHTYLSKVFKHKAVKLIASFSNSAFPFLLNKDIWINYNFSFYPLHTFELYENELFNDEISWFNKKQTKGSESTRVVYKSLTKLQREVLKLLAEKLSTMRVFEIEYNQFFEFCVDEMILSSENQLKDSLMEAITHNIVIEKVNDNQRRILKMPNAVEAFNIFSQEDENMDDD